MLKHVPRHVLRDVPVRHVLGLKFVISTALLGGDTFNVKNDCILLIILMYMVLRSRIR